MLDPSVYLQNQGWKIGRGLHEHSISRPIAAPRKRNLNGIGRDRDDGHLFHSSLFDAAAKSIDIKIEDSSDDEDGDKDSDSDNNKAIPKSLSLSRTSTGILSTRTPSSVPSTQLAFEQAKQSIAKRKLYSRFRKGQTYTGGELQKFLQEPKQRVPETQQPKPSKKKRKAEGESGKSKSSKKSSKNKGNAWADLL